VAQVLSEDKRAKIEKAVDLCAEHVVHSDEVLKLGKLIERADGRAHLLFGEESYTLCKKMGEKRDRMNPSTGLPSGSARGFKKV
jgi:hypothetical protein